MTVATLIRKRLKVTGQSKRSAAADLKVTRQTFEFWLAGTYVPEPEPDRVRTIAQWAEEEFSEILAMILREKGFVDDELPNSPKGDYLSSDLVSAAA